MTCAYLVLRGNYQGPEPCPLDRQGEGEYCRRHQRMIDEVDEIDRFLNDMIRNRQRGADNL